MKPSPREVRLAILGKLAEWKMACERKRAGFLIPDPLLEHEITCADHAMRIVQGVIDHWRMEEEGP